MLKLVAIVERLLKWALLLLLLVVILLEWWRIVVGVCMLMWRLVTAVIGDGVEGLHFILHARDVR